MVNTTSSDADWQRCVRERRYPPGVMPGTPQGKKFLGSIDIARAAREAVREAPRMPREVREKVWALLGTSRPSQPAPPKAREEPTPRPPARKKIDVEQDELLSARRLARHLDVTEPVAKLMVHRGILGSLVVGRTRYVPTSEADRWSKLGEAPPRDPAPTKGTPAQPNLSAVERARAELDRMRSGSWARPDGWDADDEYDHHAALCEAMRTGDEGYFDAIAWRRELREWTRKSFWHDIHSSCAAGAMRQKLLAGWVPKRSESESAEEAIAGAWVIAQEWEEDALRFDVTVGDQTVENEFRRTVGVPERWSWACQEGHDRVTEYWSTELAAQMAGRQHAYRAHPGSWQQVFRDSTPMDPESEGHLTPPQNLPCFLRQPRGDWEARAKAQLETTVR